MRHVISAAVLIVLCVAVYFPAFNYDFINFDDPMYVTHNPVVQAGLTAESVVDAFTDQSISLWTPLTILSYQIEVELFGVSPAVMHRTNVALHALNGVLLYVLLFRLTAAFWPSLFVAVLFAVHPTRVESVAWISERKDVLSTVFWMLSLIVWIGYARGKSKAAYVVTLILFVLGLLAKPMVMTLPAAMLILDFWPLGRFRDLKQVVPLTIEKLPFFLVAAAFLAITILTQTSGEAIDESTAVQRAANVLVSYVGYISQTLYPADLAVMYPRPRFGYPIGYIWACATVLAALSGFAIALWRRAPYVAAGWFWFLVTLVPVIGGVTLGALAMADRYTYVPTIGIFIIAAWGAAEIGSRYSGQAQRRVQGAMGVCASALIAILSVSAHAQVQTWKDSETLFAHALEVTGPSMIPYIQLATVCLATNRNEEAREYATAALSLYPESTLANNQLAIVYVREGNLNAAAPHLEKTLRNPALRAFSLQRLAAIAYLAGDDERAAARLLESTSGTSDQPGSTERLRGLIEVVDSMLSRGRFDEAERLTAWASGLLGESASLYFLRGTVAGAQGQEAVAESNYVLALELDPKLSFAWVNLANLEARRGNFAAAIENYRKALAINPNYRLAHVNLGEVYRLTGNLELARRHREIGDVLGSERP